VFLSDRKNSLALKYLLIQAVEAIVDVCQHLLAKTKGVVCSGEVLTGQYYLTRIVSKDRQE